MSATKDHSLKVFLELLRMPKKKQELLENGIIYDFSFPMWDRKISVPVYWPENE